MMQHSLSKKHLENIDCLICHQKDYKRKKDTVTGLMIPDTANMTITMDQASRQSTNQQDLPV